MLAGDLKTLKEVAEWAERPPHRFIHLCEQKVVVPAVESQGRGTVRRFNRTDVFRLLLGLHMQEMGLQVPMINRLMIALDQFLEIPEIQKMKEITGDFDLVWAIKETGSFDDPTLAFLSGAEKVHLYAPRLKIVPRLIPSVNLVVPKAVEWTGAVTVTINLWMVSNWLR